MQTAELSDKHPGKFMAADPGYRSYGGKKRFQGAVVTLKLFEDNSLVRKVLGTPGTGKVLVVDGGGSMRSALLGDQLAALAVENGWEGVLIYGCIRDSAAISEMNLGVMALGTHPFKTEKRNEGQENLRLRFSGLTIEPGDYLYADEDGILLSKELLSL